MDAPDIREILSDATSATGGFTNKGRIFVFKTIAGPGNYEIG